MRQLILIKHASPLVDPATPSHEWGLSDEGREKSRRLAAVIAAHDAAVILTSDEPKAVQTGEILSADLGKPLEIGTDLHEHDRSDVPHMPTREFISHMALFFKTPDQLVLGRETAHQAHRRFAAAVDGALTSHPDGNLAIVTHGTVLALFIAGHTQHDPFQLWRRMALPSLAVFAFPDWKLLDLVDRIT